MDRTRRLVIAAGSRAAAWRSSQSRPAAAAARRRPRAAAEPRRGAGTRRAGTCRVGTAGGEHACRDHGGKRPRQRVRRRVGRRHHAQALVARRPRGARASRPGWTRWSAAFQTEYPNVTVKATTVRDGHLDPDADDRVPVQDRSGPLVQLGRHWSLEPGVEGLHRAERGRPRRQPTSRRTRTPRRRCTRGRPGSSRSTASSTRSSTTRSSSRGRARSRGAADDVGGVIARLEKPSRRRASRPSPSGLKDGFGGEIIAAGQLEKQWVNARRT